MVRACILILLLIIFSLILSACSLLEAERPLPTHVSTAVPIAEQGGLEPAPVPTYTPRPTVRPTQAVPTASSTSPSTPTETISPLVEDVATAAADEEGVRDIATAVSEATPTPTVGEENRPTATPSVTPSLVPSNTPTAAPTNTNTPPQVSFPLPPEVAWPAATPHNFPVSQSPRHGAALAWGGGSPAGSFGPGPYSWTYTWRAFAPETPAEVEHVPMLVGNPRNDVPALERVKELDGYTAHNYWLVFNECEHQHQCNTSPAEAAQFYHDRVVDVVFTQGGDADADLIIGGVNAHPCGIVWLKNFVDYYRVTYGELPYTGWHFHLYPEIAPSGWPQSCNGNWSFNDWLFPDAETAFRLWEDHAANALAFVQEYGRPDDEVWFTEMGCLNYGSHQVQGPVCQAEGFMEEYAGRILGWLNSEGRWVTRYAWYTSWDTRYWTVTHLIGDAPDGERWRYSSLGYWYSQIEPAAAVPVGSGQ